MPTLSLQLMVCHVLWWLVWHAWQQHRVLQMMQQLGCAIPGLRRSYLSWAAISELAHTLVSWCAMHAAIGSMGVAVAHRLRTMAARRGGDRGCLLGQARAARHGCDSVRQRAGGECGRQGRAAKESRRPEPPRAPRRDRPLAPRRWCEHTQRLQCSC